MSSQLQNSSPRIIWALDYGTRNGSVAFWIGSHGDVPQREDIWVLKAPNGGYVFPQIVAYQGSHFIFGQKVLDVLEELAPDQAIQLLKLSHYPEFQESERGQDIQKQLKAVGKHVTEVLADHFKAFRELIKPYIKRELIDLIPYSASEIDDMQMEAFLAVPACWDGLSNRIMSDAAVLAGFEMFELVGEPQCHVSFIEALDLKKIEDGSRVIVVDGGAGTVDCTTYIIQRLSSDRSKYELVPSNCPPQARACGSEMVTENYIAEATRQTAEQFPGGIPVLAEKYERTTLSIKTTFAESFERIKHAFPMNHSNSTTIQYISHRFWSPGQELKHIDIALDSATISRLFDPVVQQVFAVINSQIEGTNNVLLLRGGFSESRHLQDRIREQYGREHCVITPSGQGDHRGRDQQVVQGALRAFEHPMPKHWPPEASLGLCQDETYKQSRHPDCCTRRKKGPGTKRAFNKHLVRGTGNERLAADRMSWIIRKGETLQQGQPARAERWLEFSINPAEERFILIRLACNTGPEAELQDHQAVWDKHGRLRPGFELMQPIFKLPDCVFQEDGDLGCYSEKDPKFNIHVRLDFTAASHEILLKVQVVKQGVTAFDNNGNLFSGIRFEHEELKTVWSMENSHFVRPNVVFKSWGAPRQARGTAILRGSNTTTDMTSNSRSIHSSLSRVASLTLSQTSRSSSPDGSRAPCSTTTTDRQASNQSASMSSEFDTAPGHDSTPPTKNNIPRDRARVFGIDDGTDSQHQRMPLLNGSSSTQSPAERIDDSPSLESRAEHERAEMRAERQHQVYTGSSMADETALSRRTQKAPRLIEHNPQPFSEVPTRSPGSRKRNSDLVSEEPTADPTDNRSASTSSSGDGRARCRRGGANKLARRGY